MNRFVACPHCGANIEVEEGVERFNCPHCGLGILISERDNMKETTKNVVFIQPSKKKKIGNIIGMLVAIVFFIGIGYYFGHINAGKTQEMIVPGIITPQPDKPKTVWMPFSYKDALKLSCTEVEKELRDAEFTNIELEAITKKPLFSRAKTGDIKKITIHVGDKDKNNFKKDDQFKSDMRIVITYYKFD